jgi:superfamily II DNA or RNA helicase
VPAGFAYLFKEHSTIDNRKDTGKQVAFPWKTRPYDPRDYQKEALDLMNCSYRGLINFATGLGKTLTAVYAIRAVGRRALILCPSQSIADNFYQELCSAFGDSAVGYFGGGKKQLKDITVGIAQSVNNHIDKFVKHELGLVIVDEVHHIAADTFFTIAKSLSSVGRMFGLTATDFRSDGKDVMIQAGVGEVLIKRDIVWGIKNGWLAYPHIVMRNVETTGRDYPEDKIKNYKAHVLNSPEMNERIIKDIRKCLDAKKSVLCLVDEKEHGRILAEALGLPFATGDDKLSTEYVKQLNAGTIPGLIGTDSKVGEGTDTKNVDVLVLANFVASKGPLWQNLGRGLRIHNSKEVLVLDYRPMGSKMLSRHADQRLKLYKAITSSIKEI